MTAALRAVRGDLRLAARPVCLVVMLGAALLAGLSSAVMQDTAYQQFANARHTVSAHVWEAGVCNETTAACRRERADARAQAQAFLAEQTRVATREGHLQTIGGALRYAALFMGLVTGAVIVALLAGLTIGGEWSRGTMGLALGGGIAAERVALRRFVSLFLLSLITLAVVAVGTCVAALWGASARPLIRTDAAIIGPLAGSLLLIAAYSATATAVAWVTRDAWRTLLLTLLAIGACAATTPLGPLTPGASAIGLLGIDRVLELEIGYVWMWPGLSFPTSGQASPAHVLATPAWPLATALVAAAIAVLLIALRRYAARTDAIT